MDRQARGRIVERSHSVVPRNIVKKPRTKAAAIKLRVMPRSRLDSLLVTTSTCGTAIRCSFGKRHATFLLGPCGMRLRLSSLKGTDPRHNEKGMPCGIPELTLGNLGSPPRPRPFVHLELHGRDSIASPCSASSATALFLHANPVFLGGFGARAGIHGVSIGSVRFQHHTA